VHFCPNAPVTKYELLVLLARLLRKDLKIVRARSKSGPVSRILDSRLACMKSLYPKKEPFEKALEELVNFCKK
jgi:hypothetical protein